jgi:hypothetical protein
MCGVQRLHRAAQVRPDDFTTVEKKKDVQAGLKRKAKYSMPSWAESPKIENNLKRYAE